SINLCRRHFADIPIDIIRKCMEPFGQKESNSRSSQRTQDVIKKVVAHRLSAASLNDKTEQYETEIAIEAARAPFIYRGLKSNETEHSLFGLFSLFSRRRNYSNRT